MRTMHARKDAPRTQGDPPVKTATPVGFRDEVMRCKTDESDIRTKFVKRMKDLEIERSSRAP